jgi:serine 3-dehydrogenase
MSLGLQNRIAVVTGASSGIGAAIARELSVSGVKLVLTARRADKLFDLSRELPGEVETVAADIAASETPRRLLERARKRFGGIDIVVNNAGGLAMGPVDDVDLEALSGMIRINFEAVVRTCTLLAGISRHRDLDRSSTCQASRHSAPARRWVSMQV